ncbi:hypothetical protein [Sphingopyxis sp. JAI128]|uniref:hypothetical protein n=1 Tax=Sphingopyxis sp. JAI128 TaxID=2723066 RepID=UPI00160B0C8A|nr:hypothetical protein [Sphingopyxis sp. JAI128]MBB6424993.1 hypothetical protein [Sphingopyxis sp. JAI128]
MDDGIRERHGLTTGNQGIVITETERHVCLEGHAGDRNLTEWQARYLAAKMYRLARRIRARREAYEQSKEQPA